MLQFVREIPIRIVLQGALSNRRGFLFYMSVGFSAEVDPLSGMTVNLVAVDEWLGSLKEDLEESIFISPTDSLYHAYAELMAVSRLNLLEKADKENVKLTSLRFREERGWSFSWDSQLPADEMNFSFSHYLESLSSSERFDLLKLEFEWRRQPSCESDLQHEGFKILKEVSQVPAADLRPKLHESLGYLLKSGTSLVRIHIHHLGEGYRLSLP